MQLISRFTRRPGEPATPTAEPKRQGADAPDLAALTPRELEILQLLTEGKSNPEIAQQLVISRATAKTHVERIIRKLRVSDRTQAAFRAIELGLDTLETGE